jgi:LysM repeat protein
MQHDNSDDPYGFWKDEPTRQLKRTQAGTRSHAEPEVTRMVPLVRIDRTRQMSTLRQPRNPLLTRVGLLVGVMLLFVPIALSLRTDKSSVRAADIQGVDTILVGRLPAPAPTEPTQPPTSALATTLVVLTAAPTPPPTEAAVVVTPEPTDPPTTVPKKQVVAKTTTSVASKAPPATTQSADKAPCALTYTIAKGDTWSTIASRAKVTMKALLAANGATVNTLLLPGKSVCLPAGAVTPTAPTTTAKPPSTTAKPPSTTQPTTTQPKPTTPPATTAPPSTQPPPPANTYTKAQVTQIIRNVWPDDLEDEAIRIATRESNLIPTVKNWCCYGLFQIYYNAHRTWLATMGITDPAQLYDPLVNSTAALALYRISGWAPWGLPTTTTTTAV